MVRLFPGVPSLVLGDLVTIFELLTTNITLVWFLSCN